MKKLTLKKETISDLTTSELGGVVGGTFRTKYDCTISHDFCVELSEDACVHSVQAACLPTYRFCTSAQTC